MGSSEIIWHPEALREAREARDWYLERSPLAARGFVHALESAVSRVRENPDRWLPRARRCREHIFPNRYPYTLVYRYDGRCVNVIAVAHQSRRPDYWTER